MVSFFFMFNADSFASKTSNYTWSSKHRVDEQEHGDIDTDEVMVDKIQANQTERTGYVTQTAVALRSRVMPPPCLKNPYVMNDSETATDPFGYQRSKCASELFLPSLCKGLRIIVVLQKKLCFNCTVMQVFSLQA